ncbi:hypothetical protein D515_02020 [Grimontia indica]|uniref:Uncharacterized protein n=1 Tax=Grimontia indica TaxID=1056512 RepID=R1GS98_9GAMM|nr:hypothetical protein D515_02020 [Grimontia indica]
MAYHPFHFPVIAIIEPALQLSFMLTEINISDPNMLKS